MTEFTDVDTLEKAESLRVIRNECAEWMTRDTSWISPEQQVRFFEEKILTGEAEGLLLLSDGAPAAYGLLAWDGDGIPWLSNGVSPRCRRKGFGRAAAVETTRRAREHGVPVMAEVRADNAGEQVIVRSIGYCQVGQVTRNGRLIDVLRCDELTEAYR